MYSKEIIKSAVTMYYSLQSRNIIGKIRNNLITTAYEIHMNTLYNWIKTYYCKNTKTFNFNEYKTKYKYNNTKITKEIEDFIIKSIDSNNQFKVRSIRKNIKKTFKTELSKSTIYHVFHKHGLTNKKLTVKHNPYSDEKTAQLKNELKTKIENVGNSTLISYYEMSIYLEAKPRRGWVKRDHHVKLKAKTKAYELRDILLECLSTQKAK